MSCVTARMLSRPGLLGVALGSLIGLTTGAAMAQGGAAMAQGGAGEAQQHLNAGMSAASGGRWDAALSEFTASNAAQPSVVAQEGLANAHFQLHHDAEARQAYQSLLNMNVQIPAGDTATQQSWNQTRATAQQRLAELDARAQAKAPGGGADVVVEDKDARKANNAIFLELGGNGLIYSLNYERLFGDSNFSVRLGISYISVSAGSSSNGGEAKATFMTFPILGNYYVGGRNHKLQLGGGVSILYASASSSSGGVGPAGVESAFVPAPTVAIGYRYLPVKPGFTFFIGLTPFIVPGGKQTFFPWAGMSFGGIF